MRTSASNADVGSLRGRGRRLAAAAATAGVLGVAAVGCGGDDPALEGPETEDAGEGTEDAGEEQQSEEGSGDGGLY